MRGHPCFRGTKALCGGPAPLPLVASGLSPLPCTSMRWILPLVLIPLLGRCGPSAADEPSAHASAVDTTDGYLVIQAEAARWWGFTPGDTLSERSLEDVPSLVQQAAHGGVTEYLRWESPCYRYFRGRTNYVVLVDGDCPYAGGLDGRILMGVTPAGVHLNPPWTHDGSGVVERICPGDRDRSGREARGKWQTERCSAPPAPAPPVIEPGDTSPEPGA